MSITPDLVLSNVGSTQNRKRGESLEDFMSRLVQLSLNEKHVKDMEGIENYPSLRLLYLRNNQISSISNLNHFQLTHLDLQYNSIRKLDRLQSCPSLTDLYLSFNCISEIVGLDDPENVTELNLSSQNFDTTIDSSTIPTQLPLTAEVLAPVAV